MKLTQTIICFAILFLTSTQVYGQDEYNLDETYQIDREGMIYLSSNDAEVSIEGSNRSDVRLVIYRYVDVDGINIGSSGSFRMDVEQRGGDLYIQENNSENRTMFIGSVDEEYRITLEVPRNLALDLKGDDDSYEISNTNGAISINADDSDIELSEVTGEDFDFDLDDGNISID